MMALLKFIGLFMFSHGGNWNQEGWLVPLIWRVAFCSGLAALTCGRLGRNLPTLITA